MGQSYIISDMAEGDRPRVLWVVPRMMWPVLSGGEIRVISLMRRLAGRCRLSLMFPAANGQETRAAATALYLERQGLEKVHVVPRSRSREPGFWDRLKPRTVQDFFDPAFAVALRAALRADKTDLVQLEFAEMGQYARLAREFAPTILTEHDAGFITWNRHYQRPEPRRYAGEPALEWLRRNLYELAAFRHCDRVIALSAADAAIFGRLTNPNKIRVVPTGVNLEDFPFQPLAGREPGSVVFVGFYGHYPNEDAAVSLCRDIWPRLCGLIPNAKLQLVGSSPTPRVHGLAREGIEVTGPVPAVHPFLAKARLFAAPVRLGRGIKGKILEAFASGTPVVALEQSCEAMPELRDGEHLLIARSADEFAQKAALLLRDDALSARLARAARELVEKKWGYDRQADSLYEVYRELAAPDFLR
jgi:glycosyltransferase involved in cell wall biosynthesis